MPDHAMTTTPTSTASPCKAAALALYLALAATHCRDIGANPADPR